MKKHHKYLIILCIISVFNPFTFAVETPAVVELTHWWNTPAELSALNEIKKAVVAKGGEFSDIKIKSWDELRTSTIKRLRLGYPPAATQWLSGDSLTELSNLKAITHLPEKWRGEKVSDILFDEVFRVNQHNKQLISIPLGIHIQNSALFNAKIYNHLNLTPPTHWDEFLIQAEIIKKAGFVPIALSKEIWQFKAVFDTMLLENLKADKFKLFYLDKQSIAKWKEEITKTLTTFIKLKNYTDNQQQNRSWSEAVNLIAEDKAAMHVLGDFSKGVLSAMGLKAGEDFLCSLAPGSDGSVVYAIDSFVMLNMEEESLRKGQKLLFDTVLDPKIQVAYNSKKGSIPVRKDVKINMLDSCAQQSYKHWLKQSENSISFSDTNYSMRASYVQTLLKQAWNTDITAEELTHLLINNSE